MAEERSNPYVGPRTFEEEDKGYFFGREREAHDLLSLVRSRRLVLFYAQSGAGKSSLINTRLKPALNDEGFAVLPTGRVSGAVIVPAKAIKNIYAFHLLHSIYEGSSEESRVIHASVLPSTTISQYLQLKRQSDALAGKHQGRSGRVLIIDQFEEILTGHPEHWQERQPFFLQLRQAMEDDPLLRLVLVTREDHVAGLDPYARFLPDRLQVRYYMQRMRVAGALAAISEPAAQAGRPFTTEAAHTLVAGLSRITGQKGEEDLPGEFVEPVQLQVVCYQLWEQIKGTPGREITQADVDRYANVSQVLGRFYESAIAAALKETSLPERTLRHWFEEQLITERQTRGLVFRGETATGELPNELVRIFEQVRLVHPISRPGGTWYELVHDSLVQPILKANQAWRLGQSPLVQSAEAWEQSGRDPALLFEGQQLKTALAAYEQKKLDPMVQRFLEASQEAQAQRDRRRFYSRLALVFTSLLLVGALVATFFAVRESNRANLNEAQAVELAKLAQEKAAEAEASAAQAESSAREAQAAAEALAERNAALAASEQRAEEARQQAEANARAASSRQLATEALAALPSDQQLGLLLAIEAVSATHTVAADGALRLALATSERAGTLADGGQPVFHLAFDAQGRYLLMLDGDGVTFWSVPASFLGRVPPGEDDDRPTAVALSPDGDRLLTLGRSGVARQWDVPCLLGANAGLACAELLPGRYTALAYTPGGKELVTADSEGNVLLWLAEEPRLNAATRLGNEAGWATQLQASPDGAWLAALGRGGSLWLGSLAQPGSFSGQLAQKGAGTAFAFSPDGSWLAVAGAAGSLNLWQTKSAVRGNGEPDALLSGHRDEVNALRFSPDGRWLASAGRDRSVHLWDMAALEAGREGQAALFEGHSDGITALDFSPDGQWLASASLDGTVRLWDVANQQRPGRVFSGEQGELLALAFSPDSQYLASGGAAGSTALWLVAETLPALPGDGAPVTAYPNSGGLAFAGTPGEEAGILAVAHFAPEPGSAEAPGPLELWRVPPPLFSTPFSRVALSGTLPFYSLAASPAGNLLATSSITFSDSLVPAHSELALWDLSTAFQPAGPRLLRRLPADGSAIFGLAFNPDGSSLAAARVTFANSTVPAASALELWSVAGSGSEETAGPALTLPLHGLALDVAFSPDGQWLAASNRTALATSGTVSVWAGENLAASGTEQQPALTLPDQGSLGRGRTVSSPLTFVLGGSMLVTAGKDYSLNLWPLKEVAGRPDSAPEPAFTLRGHEATVLSLAASPDGRLLASGSEDGVVRLWDVGQAGQPGQTPALLAVIRPPEGRAVIGLAFSADGRLLAVRQLDASILLYTLMGDDLRQLGCSRTNGNLTQAELEAHLINHPITCANLPPDNSVLRHLIWNNGLDDGAAHALLLRQAQQVPALSPQINSQMAQAWIAVGNRLARERRPDEALLAFKHALEWEPTLSLQPGPYLAQQLVTLGREDAFQGRIDEALERLRRAVELDPGLEIDADRIAAQALVDLGRELIDEGRTDEALLALTEAAELDGSLNQAIGEELVRLGEEYVFRGRPEDAVATWYRALEIDPSLDVEPEQIGAEVLFSLSFDYAESGRHRDAVRALKQALALAQDAGLVEEIGFVLQEFGLRFAAEGDLENALAALNLARSQDTTPGLVPEEVAAQGLVEGAGKQAATDPLQALETLRVALELAPSQGASVAQALLDLVEPLMEANRPDQVLAALDLALLADPDLATANPYALARSYNVICEAAGTPVAQAAAPLGRACGQAADLSSKLPDLALNSQVCLDGLAAGEAQAVVPACRQAVSLASDEKKGSLLVAYDLCRALRPNPEVANRASVAEAAEVGNLVCGLVAQRTHPIAFGQAVFGTVPPSDGEIWSFQGKAGQAIAIRMASFDSDLDSVVTLYGPDDLFLGSDDQSGGANDALLAGLVLPLDGTYLIVAQGYVDSVGSYVLTLTEEGARLLPTPAPLP